MSRMAKIPPLKRNFSVRINRGKAENIKRGDYYRTSRWRKLRRYVLIQEPLCRACRRRGVYKAATCVDHILRHSGPDDALFTDRKNLQPLCQECHSAKTAKESIRDDTIDDRSVSNRSENQNADTSEGSIRAESEWRIKPLRN